MDWELLSDLKEQKKERESGSFNSLVNANVELMDKLKWLKKEIQKEIDKLEHSRINREEIINDLKSILDNND